MCTLLAAFYLARRRGSDWQTQVDLDEQTDAMVAALRGLADQAKQAPGTEDGPSRGRTRCAQPEAAGRMRA